MGKVGGLVQVALCVLAVSACKGAGGGTGSKVSASAERQHYGYATYGVSEVSGFCTDQAPGQACKLSNIRVYVQDQGPYSSASGDVAIAGSSFSFGVSGNGPYSPKFVAISSGYVDNRGATRKLLLQFFPLGQIDRLEILWDVNGNGVYDVGDLTLEVVRLDVISYHPG